MLLIQDGFEQAIAGFCCLGGENEVKTVTFV